MHLVPGQQIGKYATIHYVGSGVFGAVYLMHDNLMNRDVAVKFVENQNPTAFVAHFEAQILHRCRSDRIVAINSADVIQDTNGRQYAAIDMEYLPDGSAQRLVETQHISIRQSIKLAIDLLFALGYAHRHGILHRDVKPANILLAGARAKLSDFGLATSATSSLTASGAGSPVYCAPEVINDNITTAQTDVFAAGMTLFQLANNISNLAANIPSLDTIKMGRVISAVGYKECVPRRLRYICNKACATDPARRYASVDEMRQSLEKLRVLEDWKKPTSAVWQASIKGHEHEMRVEVSSEIEMVYKINGRRKNANCRKCATTDRAELEQERWVYQNTF